ncbi:MAG: DUF5320 domain-containing protein [Deltaproteobacteria bacterium]|nr:DUF5320 domain-containing protein [Deltaproteobacteria bacterium]
MPGFDGTGPWGQGPGTGWGLGPCGAGRRWGYGFGFRLRPLGSSPLGLAGLWLRPLENFRTRLPLLAGKEVIK